MALDTTVGFKFKASVEGQQQLDKFNQSLQQSGKYGEVSAGQIRAAMRTLPAQFTDIATQLAGGQSPFLVLLQQGGQIKDQFGGVGNAIRGISSLISPFTILMGGAAAAVGAFAYATYEAISAHADFQRALNTTGNYAGMTAERFEAAAGRIQAATGATDTTAKTFLQSLIETGQFGPRSIEAVAQAMVTVSKATGQSADDVKKMFAGMAKSASDWAYDTNKQYNFLDVAQYKYIKQLEDAGKTQEAMKVAADALNGSLAVQAQNVGGLAGMWQRAKETMSGYFASLGKFGDQLVDGENTNDTLGRVRNMIALKQASLSSGRYTEGSRGYNALTQELSALKQQEAELQELQRMTTRLADTQAARAETNKAAIEAEREAEKERKKTTATKVSEFDRLRQGYEDQLIALRELGATEELIAKIEAGRYKELTPKQIEELKILTAKVGAKKAENEADKEREKQQDALDRKMAEASAAADKAQAKSVEHWKDIAEPAQKYYEQLKEIQDLTARGLLTDAQGEAATKWVDEQIDKLDELKKKGKDTFGDLEAAVRGWGKKSVDAFVDMAFGGKTSFRDLTVEVLKDIARMVIEINVLKPMLDGLKDIMKSKGGFSDWIGSGIRSFFGFANGGIMSSNGPLPLNAYANGGVATGPQLALFGEGRMNEAYVPLPDGRTIPVTMNGGGGGDVYNITVPVNMNGGDAGANSGTKAGQLGGIIAAAVRTELINQKRPGGLLAA